MNSGNTKKRKDYNKPRTQGGLQTRTENRQYFSKGEGKI